MTAFQWLLVGGGFAIGYLLSLAVITRLTRPW